MSENTKMPKWLDVRVKHTKICFHGYPQVEDIGTIAI